MHAVHRRADLVADVGQERRLHVRRLDRLVARRGELGGDPVALRDVVEERDPARAPVELDVVARDLDVDDRAVAQAVAARVGGALDVRPPVARRPGAPRGRRGDIDLLGRLEVLDRHRVKLLARVAVAVDHRVADRDDLERVAVVGDQRLRVLLEQQPVALLARAQLRAGLQERRPEGEPQPGEQQRRCGAADRERRRSGTRCRRRGCEAREGEERGQHEARRLAQCEAAGEPPHPHRHRDDQQRRRPGDRIAPPHARSCPRRREVERVAGGVDGEADRDQHERRPAATGRRRRCRRRPCRAGRGHRSDRRDSSRRDSGTPVNRCSRPWNAKPAQNAAMPSAAIAPSTQLEAPAALDLAPHEQHDRERARAGRTAGRRRQRATATAVSAPPSDSSVTTRSPTVQRGTRLPSSARRGEAPGRSPPRRRRVRSPAPRSRRPASRRARGRTAASCAAPGRRGRLPARGPSARRGTRSSWRCRAPGWRSGAERRAAPREARDAQASTSYRPLQRPP